jgi:4-diphosphocytidyl-2-C-methyl-D-erythritol kinase
VSAGRALAVEAAPAKINLALHVTGRRPDGYHELHSLVVFAGVADEVALRGASREKLTVTGPFAAAAGSGDANLVNRAVMAFRERWPGRVSGPLDLELRKNLPVAAGLGGGSSDAAAALRMLAALCDDPPPAPALAALALTLGADVPACLHTQPCEVLGIGETVRPKYSGAWSSASTRLCPRCRRR